MRFLWLGIGLLVVILSYASGNYPEAGTCNAERPWYAICTHSLHSLEGWYGDDCYLERDEAQREAEQHAKKFHGGNMRWTGVAKSREKNKGGSGY